MTIIQNANVQFDFKGLLLKGFPLSKFEVLLQKGIFNKFVTKFFLNRTKKGSIAFECEKGNGILEWLEGSI